MSRPSVFRRISSVRLSPASASGAGGAARFRAARFCVRAAAPGRFLLLFVLILVVRKHVRQEHQKQQDCACGDRDVCSGRMLDIIRNIAEIRDGEDRRADYVFIMYERTILGFVRVALGAEAYHGGIFLVRDNAHDAVRGDGALVQHERDRLSNLDGIGVDLFDIDQRAGVIRRLHGAGQDGKHLQSHDPRTDQQ